LSQASIDISSLIQSKRESVSAIRIRGFCAKDDLNSCLQFQEGHLDVLRSFGFKVSSTKEDWMMSDKVFVVIVESLCGSRTYGGARIELIDKARKLPVQLAIEDLDPRINDFVDSMKNFRSGELCGLWNSVAVAGLGIGSVYSIRAAMRRRCSRQTRCQAALPRGAQRRPRHRLNQTTAATAAAEPPAAAAAAVTPSRPPQQRRGR